MPYETGQFQSELSVRPEHPMDKFTTLEGVAAPLNIINVDTDMRNAAV